MPLESQAIAMSCKLLHTTYLCHTAGYTVCHARRRHTTASARLQLAGPRSRTVPQRSFSQAAVLLDCRSAASTFVRAAYMSPQAAETVASAASQQPQAPLKPLPVNAQHASSSIAPRRGPPRKRSRAALVEEQLTAAPASTAEADASTSVPAGRSDTAANGAAPMDTSAPSNSHVKSEDGVTDAGADAAAAAPAQQLDNSSKPKPQHKPRRTKAAAAIKLEQVAGEFKQESAGVSDADQLSVAAPSAADTIASSTQPAAKPKRKPRQSKAAAAAEAAAQAHQLQQEQAVKPDPESASDADMMSDISASAASEAAAPAQAEAGSKPKSKREPRQTKAAVAQAGDAAVGKPEAAPAPAKVDRRKKAKIEQVVAEVKAEVAQEAAEQAPAIADAPIGGLDEHKPRKIPRATKSAAAAKSSADVSASETSEESDVAVEAPAKGKARARASRAKKAPPPDAENTAGQSDASEGTHITHMFSHLDSSNPGCQFSCCLSL